MFGGRVFLNIGRDEPHSAGSKRRDKAVHYRTAVETVRNTKHRDSSGFVERQGSAVIANKRNRFCRNLIGQCNGIGTGNNAVDIIERRHFLLKQAKFILPGELAANRFVEAFHRNAAAFDRIAKAADHRINVRWFFKNIGTGKKRPNSGFLLRKIKRQAAHAHSIGDDQALKTHLFSKQIGLYFC